MIKNTCFEQQSVTFSEKSIGSNSVSIYSESRFLEQQTQNNENDMKIYSSRIEWQEQSCNADKLRPYFEVVGQIERISEFLVKDNDLMFSIGIAEQKLKHYIIKNKNNLTNLRRIITKKSKNKNQYSQQIIKIQNSHQNLPNAQNAIIHKIKELYQKRIGNCRDKRQLIFDVRQNLFKIYELVNTQIIYRQKYSNKDCKANFKHGIQQISPSKEQILCYFCCETLLKLSKSQQFCKCQKIKFAFHEKCYQNHRKRHGYEIMNCQQCKT